MNIITLYNFLEVGKKRNLVEVFSSQSITVSESTSSQNSNSVKELKYKSSNDEDESPHQEEQMYNSDNSIAWEKTALQRSQTINKKLNKCKLKPWSNYIHIKYQCIAYSNLKFFSLPYLNQIGLTMVYKPIYFSWNDLDHPTCVKSAVKV